MLLSMFLELVFCSVLIGAGYAVVRIASMFLDRWTGKD